MIEPEVFDHVKVESLSNDAPQSFPLGETIVTWMVADSSGNVSTSSHKVIVVDTTSPEIFINNVTLEGMISSGSELLLPTPQINDIDEVIVTNNAPTIFPFGETIVTWTATDQSGNVATKEQSVNVVDTIRPLLVIPDDIEVEANGINTIIDDLGELTVNDISDIAYTTNDAPEKFPLGETIVTWAVSDIAGNSVSGTQLVTVVDTTLPEIIAPSDIKLEAVDLTENYIELVEKNFDERALEDPHSTLVTLAKETEVSIREPLNTIIGYSELLLEDNESIEIDNFKSDSGILGSAILALNE